MEEKSWTATLGERTWNTFPPHTVPPALALLFKPVLPPPSRQGLWRGPAGDRPAATAAVGSGAPGLPRQRVNTCKFSTGCPGADWPTPLSGHREEGGARVRQRGGRTGGSVLALGPRALGSLSRLVPAVSEGHGELLHWPAFGAKRVFSCQASSRSMCVGKVYLINLTPASCSVGRVPSQALHPWAGSSLSNPFPSWLGEEGQMASLGGPGNREE